MFSYVGARHQDSRFVESKKGYREMMEETSIVPFVAQIRGKQPFPTDLPWVGIGGGLALAIGLRLVHDDLVAWITP